jgi:hypothetical protein
VLMPLFLGATVVAVLHAVALVLGLGLLFAPVVALVAFIFWRIMRPDDRGQDGHRAVLIITAVGSLVGTVVAAAAHVPGATGWAWSAIPLAVLLASAIFSLAFAGGAKTCQLCRQPAPEHASFACPRCHDRVCARPTCWSAKYLRCVRCHEREIIALPQTEAWWRPRLGARAKHGQCGHCFKEAHETDLRECGKCHWPMCQRCWDYHNGICQRCRWVIPDLPPALAAYVNASAGMGRDRPAAAAPGGARRPASTRPVAPAGQAPRPAARPDPRAGAGREGAASASPPQRPGRRDPQAS